MIEAMGGICKRCGLDDWRVLQVDHINGGGKVEYATIGRREVFRRALSGCDSYQLLCANCNLVKYYEEIGLIYEARRGRDGDGAE